MGEVLGEGFFGVVYACRDVWENDLAAEVLRPGRPWEQIKAAAERELRSLLLVRNPFVTFVMKLSSIERPLAVERAAGRLTIEATAEDGPWPRLVIAPALPLDARVRSVAVDGTDAPFRAQPDGDVQRIEVAAPAGAVAPAGAAARTRRVTYTYDDGTDAFARVELPEAGAVSEGLRIPRSRAERGALHLIVEGRAGRTYRLGVRTPRRVGTVPGVTATPNARGADLAVAFEGPPGEYVRRTIDLPLR